MQFAVPHTPALPLQVLKAGTCQLPDQIVVSLSTYLSNLLDINLERSYVLTSIIFTCYLLYFCINNVVDTGVTAIAKNLPNLTWLNLAECVRVDNTGVLAVARGLRKLQFLNISAMRIDGDPSMCPTSHHLSFIILTRLKVKELGRQAPPLRTLVLARCPEVDDSSMAVLAQNVPTLTKLDISGDDKITDKSIFVLAQYILFLLLFVIFIVFIVYLSLMCSNMHRI